jgi:predicted ATPase/transcriptional regulator with XRE-family HTH domain
MDHDRAVGTWIRSRRRELDLTREQLAEQVGCSVETIRKIEAAERRPSRQIAERLARALALAPEEQADFVRAARARPPIPTGAAAPHGAGATSTAQPAPAALPSAAAQALLLATTTPFVGREAELATIAGLLANPACRLITLLGPGGMGKTRLALHVVERRPAFADGVAVVPLAAVASADLLAPTIASAVGCSLHGSGDPVEQLARYLCDKQLLLLLDNMEHLRDGAGANRSLLTVILEQAPGVRLLVTSRERMHLSGEWVVELQGLPLPRRDDESFDRSSAVALFLQKAQQVRVGFTPNEADRPHIARICQLVDGMPLAIELAAAWVRALSCAEIAVEVTRGLEILSSSERDVAARHQSMRVAIDQSWQLLTEAERATLRKLSVFRGGCRREAAAAVAGATLPLLTALIDKSLLRHTPAGRYDLHELVRHYAATQLDDNLSDSTSTHERHTYYYAAWLAQQERQLKGAQQRAAVEELRSEIDNLRAAWAWAVEHRRAALVTQALPCLWYLYEILGWYQEGAAHFSQAAATWSGGLSSDVGPLRGQLLAYQAWFCLRMGEHAQATDLLQQSRALLESLDDPAACAMPLFIGGVQALLSGDMDLAHQDLERSLALHRAIDDRWGMAYCLHYLGLEALGRHALLEAGRQLREGLALLRALGDPRLTASCLIYLGNVDAAQGEYDGAERHYEESLALSEGVEDRWGIAYALRHQGTLALARGEPQQAATLLRESAARLRELGERWALAQALADLGMAALALDDDRAARRAFREVLSGEITPPIVRIALQALLGMATLLAKVGPGDLVAELVAVILRHPASSPESRERAERLWDDAQPGRPIETATGQHEHGTGRSFDALVAAVLATAQPE